MNSTLKRFGIVATPILDTFGGFPPCYLRLFLIIRGLGLSWGKFARLIGILKALRDEVNWCNRDQVETLAYHLELHAGRLRPI